MNLEQNVNPHIRELQPYQSARRIGGHGHTFLNANESPKSELYMFNSTTLNRYPDCQPQEILEGMADYTGLKTSEIIISRGSDEIIGLTIRAFCAPGSEGILIAPPTYGMYEVAAHTNYAKVAVAQRNHDFSISADALIEAANNADFKVKIIFIDSPANPLGTIFPEEELRKLLTALPEVLVVLDEAYIEYCPDYDRSALIREFDNLLVMRTLSKAFALAGIRCGFGLAQKQIISVLLKVIDPYPVPDPVAQIARQALARGGINLMRARVSDCLKRREILDAALRDLPMVEKVFPSEANFLLVKFKNGPQVFDALAQKGIILRSFETKPGLANCVRISVGSAEELDETMRALTALSQVSPS